MTHDPKKKGPSGEASKRKNEDRPELRATAIRQPNRAKSEVVHVRLSEPDYRALSQVAESLGVSVSDAVRSAIHGFVHAPDSDREAEFLIHALHESGLRLVRR